MRNPLLFLCLILFSCSPKEDPNESLKQEVIAIHDEVMPMMGGFVRDGIAIDSILNNFESIKIENPAIDTTEEKARLTELKSDIESANESMNDWMHQLNLDFDTMTQDEVTLYLEDERAKIVEINNQFKKVEAERQEILSNYNQDKK